MQRLHIGLVWSHPSFDFLHGSQEGSWPLRRFRSMFSGWFVDAIMQLVVQLVD
jgi:hypothetical protein